MANKTVTVDADELAGILQDVEHVRMAFLVCAPKFAAGSIGELAVVAAKRMGPEIGKMKDKIKDGI